jgi:hypothetical protein
MTIIDYKVGQARVLKYAVVVRLEDFERNDDKVWADRKAECHRAVEFVIISNLSWDTAACETPFKKRFFSETQQNVFSQKHDPTTYSLCTQFLIKY